jgi:hypothetical protein
VWDSGFFQESETFLTLTMSLGVIVTSVNVEWLSDLFKLTRGKVSNLFIEMRKNDGLFRRKFFIPRGQG